VSKASSAEGAEGIARGPSETGEGSSGGGSRIATKNEGVVQNVGDRERTAHKERRSRFTTDWLQVGKEETYKRRHGKAHFLKDPNLQNVGGPP